MKIIVAPDSYKGSLTAIEVGATIKKAFLAEMKDVTIDVIPMADGGEGTLDAIFSTTKGTRVSLDATGPLQERILTEYGVLDDDTVVIEMAKVAGLPMVPADQRNPMNTTTIGVGELVLHAIDAGYRNFMIGIGGSATNDGGFGMLHALGVLFLDVNHQPVTPIAGNLKLITIVSYANMDSRLRQCCIKVAADVENYLCGPQGASYVFGPQKGASDIQIAELDQSLQHYADLIETHLKQGFRNKRGAGAAGGLGFAFLTIGAELIPGSKMIAEATGLTERIKSADWVITGEGQSDYQSLYGKAPIYVAKLAKEYNVKVILISGSLGNGYEHLYDYFTSCHSIIPGPVTLEQCMINASTYLFETARNIARLMNSISFMKKR
ncbi:MAG: glycerate kinase [Bacilli bacterium]